MTPRLSGDFCTFGLVFFVLKSLLGIASQWSREKFAILTLKPRSHVRVLIYRRWAIVFTVHVKQGSLSVSLQVSLWTIKVTHIYFFFYFSGLESQELASIYAVPKHFSFPSVWKPCSPLLPVSPNLSCFTGSVVLSVSRPLSSCHL